MTSTFKLRKVELQAEGYDPTRVGDPLFVRDDAPRATYRRSPRRATPGWRRSSASARTPAARRTSTNAASAAARLRRRPASRSPRSGMPTTRPHCTRSRRASTPGKVEAGTPVEHTYVLRNDGPKTLQIVAKPGCGCTTTSYDREIPPGGTGKVTARLDTTDLRGRVEKTIDIISNDPSGRALTLTLIADSQRALIVEPNDRPLLRGPIHRVSPAVSDRTGAGRCRLPHHPRRGRGRAPGEGRGARRRGQRRAPTLSGRP